MDTSVWGGSATRYKLLESITLLGTLIEVPKLPQENVLISIDDSMHILSVQRENEIASNLAFISASSDDSLYVMATCIEEHQDKKGITIRVASNSRIPQTVTDGLNSLCRVLEKAATRGKRPF